MQETWKEFNRKCLAKLNVLNAKLVMPNFIEKLSGAPVEFIYYIVALKSQCVVDLKTDLGYIQVEQRFRKIL